MRLAKGVVFIFLAGMLSSCFNPPEFPIKPQIEFKDVVFKKVEIESEFPGGQKGWTAYLNGNLAYPKKAVRKNIQGTVVVQFIVERDGRVSNVEVVKSVDPLLDNEALRLIQQSPNWKPAVQDGKKVRSYKKQPIVFQLVEDTPKKKG